MQERYLVRRKERIQLLVALTGRTVSPVRSVIDLGCGTGSLMQPFLEAFPRAKVYGIDFDPVLLPLAEERLRSHGRRARIVLGDLRGAEWLKEIPSPVDAVVSATALHWLGERELSMLYRRIGGVLRHGGLFANADHVASLQPRLQKFWEQSRAAMRRRESRTGEKWEEFWMAYTKAVGLSGQRDKAQRVLGGWKEGVEKGMPLEWHFAKLKAGGFSQPECFWRCDCDAIYGAFR